MEAIISCFHLKNGSNALLDFIRYDTPPPPNSYIDLDNHKVASFIQNTLRVKIVSSSPPTTELFDACLEQLRSLNRIAECENDWIIFPLYRCALQLFHVATLLDSSPRQPDTESCKGDFQQENFLTKCGRATHMSLNICLKDRQPTDANKRRGAFFFAILLFKTYNRLRAYELLNNMVKVLESRAKDLPHVQLVFAHLRAFTVTYCYYLGRYYVCRKGEYKKAFKWLYTAYLHCHVSAKRQQQQILTFLLPVAFLTHRLYPSKLQLEAWDSHITNIDYLAIFSSLITGNLVRIDAILDKKRLNLLRHDLYLTLNQLRPYAVLRMIKASWLAADKHWQIPTRVISYAINRTKEHDSSTITNHVTSAVDIAPCTNFTDSSELLDYTECLVVGLINRNFVRGYLSHGNRVLVVSRNDPFPRIASRVENPLMT